MKIKPIGDRVVVKADEAEEKTAGGLIIASETKEKPSTGKIVAVGEGKLDNNGNMVKVPVKVGDKVLFSKYGGTEVTVENEEYLILRSDDILAVI